MKHHTKHDFFPLNSNLLSFLSKMDSHQIRELYLKLRTLLQSYKSIFLLFCLCYSQQPRFSFGPISVSCSLTGVCFSDVSNGSRGWFEACVLGRDFTPGSLMRSAATISEKWVVHLVYHWCSSAQVSACRVCLNASVGVCVWSLYVYQCVVPCAFICMFKQDLAYWENQQ